MRPKPILLLWKAGGRWRFDYYKPETILGGIKAREDLLLVLARHASPTTGLQHGSSRRARREHVERVRPSLRWYCRLLGVRIPTWLSLSGDARYRGLPPRIHVDLFGPGVLTVREFSEWRRVRKKGSSLPTKRR